MYHIFSFGFFFVFFLKVRVATAAQVPKGAAQAVARHRGGHRQAGGRPAREAPAGRPPVNLRVPFCFRRIPAVAEQEASHCAVH